MGRGGMSAVPQILVSVCIPTYNGEATLAETLDSIISQAGDDIEVLICDDASTDSTASIAGEYAKRSPNVRSMRNEKNVGMDRNFARAALSARGEYVWFCGQDDILEPGAIGKCREVLRDQRGVDLVYFNYRFCSDDLTHVIKGAFLDVSNDRYFEGAEDYFREIDHCPTFLPSVLMRRRFWEVTPYEQFVGTHYVQVGVWLYNFERANTVLVASPDYVTGRIPEDSWKRQSGQMLFETSSGNLDVYDSVFRSGRNCMPEEIYRKMRQKFLWHLPHYTVFYSEKGFRRTPLIEARMKKIFGGNFLLYWFWVWPLTHLPGWGYSFLRTLYRMPIAGNLIRGVRRTLGRLARSAKI
jgi:glycosyltransferase involved in cell wall biosynthesis